MRRRSSTAAILVSAALASLIVAAGPAAAGDRIKPKWGSYTWTGLSRSVFFRIPSDRSTVRQIAVSFWCGSKLQYVPVGRARIKNVGRRSVGFDLTRRVRMPHGHKVRVTMSGVWSGARRVSGSIRTRDPECAPPPKADPPLLIPTWKAIWQCGSDCVPLFARGSAARP